MKSKSMENIFGLLPYSPLFLKTFVLIMKASRKWYYQNFQRIRESYFWNSKIHRPETEPRDLWIATVALNYQGNLVLAKVCGFEKNNN